MPVYDFEKLPEIVIVSYIEQAALFYYGEIQRSCEMDKLDQKTQKKLLDALNRAREHHLQQELKREEKLWKLVEAPYRLIDTLPMLTKYELDDIRQQLELSGMSTLKKAELAVELARKIPGRLEKVLSTFDKERYDLVKKIINNAGMLPVEKEFSTSKITSLRNHGIVFPVLKDGQRHLMVPVDIMDVFPNIDQVKLQVSIRQNTDWIKLVHGMIYYYGVMESSKMRQRIETFTKGELDIRKYLGVIYGAQDYYGQIRLLHSSYGVYVTNDFLLNSEGVIEEQMARPSLDYYPFTKNQLLKAGEPDFVDKSPEMLKFLRFLSDSYDLSKVEKDAIAAQLHDMINMDASSSNIIEYLQSFLEIPSLEFLQELSSYLMDVHNHTRMWILKGHTPTESFEEEKKHLRPLPEVPFSIPQHPSNVINLNANGKSSREKAAMEKVGRNDPCPCGSGKKHKKCCGK